MSKQKKIHVEEDFNPAAKIVESILHWTKDNKNTVIGILIAIFAVVVIAQSISYSKAQELAEAKTAFGSAIAQQLQNGRYDEAALQAVYSDHNKTQLAAYSAFLLASQYVADEKFNEAGQWYDKALAQNPKESFVLSAIYEGKGVTLEATGDNSGALKMYGSAVSQNGSASARYKRILLANRVGETATVDADITAIIADSTAPAAILKSVTRIKATL